MCAAVSLRPQFGHFSSGHSRAEYFPTWTLVPQKPVCCLDLHILQKGAPQKGAPQKGCLMKKKGGNSPLFDTEIMYEFSVGIVLATTP